MEEVGDKSYAEEVESARREQRERMLVEAGFRKGNSSPVQRGANSHIRAQAISVDETDCTIWILAV